MSLTILKGGEMHLFSANNNNSVDEVKDGERKGEERTKEKGKGKIRTRA
jgi:hypothetical protein